MRDYFSHDYNARNDPKIQMVLMKLGHEGKSVFWDLIEMLYEQKGYLRLSECDCIAFALRTNSTVIQSLITEFGLFSFNDTLFWSESVLTRLNIRNDKSIKARQSANNRWKNANAMRTHSDSNAIKVKEIKVKEINIDAEHEEKTDKTEIIMQQTQYIEKVAKTFAILPEKVKEYMAVFLAEQSLVEDSLTRTTGMIQDHFKNWMKKQLVKHFEPTTPTRVKL